MFDLCLLIRVLMVTIPIKKLGNVLMLLQVIEGPRSDLKVIEMPVVSSEDEDISYLLKNFSYS